MDASGADMGASTAPEQPGTARRKRRRRRGKRGGTAHSSDAGNTQQSEANSFAGPAHDFDRFGIPDEIDTTPREEPRPQPAIEKADTDVPVAMPNAASSPVWSLTADPGEVLPSPQRRAPEPVAVPVSQEAAPEPVSTQPAGPPKKGWWQRTFKSEG
jgi:ribonuclease E